MAEETTVEETPEDTATLLRMATSLPAARDYTPMDRYRDFRKVFLGSDDGQRVFRELLSWGHMFKPSANGSPIDPLLMAIHEGERNYALRLLATVTREPITKPVRANTTAKRD
jgi:hypothetical protein